LLGISSDSQYSQYVTGKIMGFKASYNLKSPVNFLQLIVRVSWEAHKIMETWLAGITAMATTRFNFSGCRLAAK